MFYRHFVTILFISTRLLHAGEQIQQSIDNPPFLSDLCRRASTGKIERPELNFRFSASALREKLSHDKDPNLAKNFPSIIADIVASIKQSDQKDKTPELILSGRRDLFWSLEIICRKIGPPARHLIVKNFSIGTIFRFLKPNLQTKDDVGIEQRDALIYLLTELSQEEKFQKKIFERYRKLLSEHLPPQTFLAKKTPLAPMPKNLCHFMLLLFQELDPGYSAKLKSRVIAMQAEPDFDQAPGKYSLMLTQRILGFAPSFTAPF